MPDLLTLSDLETPRTPSALAVWFYAKYEEVLSFPDEARKARLPLGIYKNFIEEVYPLVIYSRWRFSEDDVLCQPKVGNQPYDAIIYPPDQSDLTHTVEITWPKNGEARKANAELMNHRGSFGWVGDDYEGYNRDILRRVRKKAQEKSRNDYRAPGGSTLLIVLDTNCRPLDERNRIAQIDMLRKDISGITFRVDSVYLVTSPDEAIYPIAFNRQKRSDTSC